MRRYSRYKIFLKGYNLNFVPNRVLNLKRPKWDLLKLKIKRLKILKNGHIATFNFFNLLNTKKFLNVLRLGARSSLYSRSLLSFSKNSKKLIKFSR